MNLTIFKNSTAQENALMFEAREAAGKQYEIVNITGHTLYYSYDQIGCEQYARCIRELKDAGFVVETCRTNPARTYYYSILERRLRWQI